MRSSSDRHRPASYVGLQVGIHAPVDLYGIEIQVKMAIAEAIGESIDFSSPSSVDVEIIEHAGGDCPHHEEHHDNAV